MIQSSINVLESDNIVLPTEEIHDIEIHIPAQSNKPKVTRKRQNNQDEIRTKDDEGHRTTGTKRRRYLPGLLQKYGSNVKNIS